MTDAPFDKQIACASFQTASAPLLKADQQKTSTKNKTHDPLFEKILSESAEKQLEVLKETDVEYYGELTKKFKLNAKKIATYAIAYYQKSNSKNKYSNLQDFLSQHFSDEVKFISPIDAYVKYLINKQSYAVNTVNAGANMPVLSRSLGIYRHGYIQIYDSPFKNGKKPLNKSHEILELNPSGQTNELNAKSVTGQVRVVPGLVTMALHLSGTERLATGEYDLINYRPWVNDCQTYFKHTQECMNKILLEIDSESGDALQQEVINHYRYKPGMTKEQAQWLRRQAGVHLDPDHKLFEVTEKGLAVISPEDKIEVVEPVGKNFRNVLEDRRIEESPSHHMLAYTAWLMKQFAQSSLDRAMKHIHYKKMEYSTQGKIRFLIKQIRKQEDFVCEMIAVINLDFINMHLTHEQETELTPYYKNIFDLKDILLKQSEALATSLKKLNSDTFNAKLNLDLNDQKKIILESGQNLRKAILKVYNTMNIRNIQGAKQKKNLIDAIADIESYQQKITTEVENVLSSGVKPGAEMVRFRLFKKKSENNDKPLTDISGVERQIENFLSTVSLRYSQAIADPYSKIWGGDIEVQQLGIIKNLKICVHYKGGAQPPVLLGSPNAIETIHLLYSGNHYEVCDALGKLTQKTSKNGDCLFEAVIKAERELKRIQGLLNKASLNNEIAKLRKEVADQILDTCRDIASGVAFHCPPGFKGEAVKLTQRDDPVWVRFNAIFEAENNLQLHHALNLLPTCSLKSEAENLKEQFDRLSLKASHEPKTRIKFTS